MQDRSDNIHFNAAQNSNMALTIKGGQVPSGVVKISGAKNSAIKLMAAALLTDEKIHLDNFPTELVDARIKERFLKDIGVKVETDQENDCIDIQADKISSDVLPHYNYPFRTTYLLTAGQLRRNGIARIPYPGGCKIGDRKYDLHIMVWEKMGCKVHEKDDHIEIIADKLRPGEINFPFATIGGTENALLCGAIAEGTTIIRNAYVSPEVEDLIFLLRSMGARINVMGNSQIKITGSSKLRGTTHRVIPDRIEALTWIIYTALSRGSVVVQDVPFDIMEVPLIHLREAGVDIFRNSNDAYISTECFLNTNIQPFEMACGTHPGIISDMQPFYVLLGLKADGISKVVDYRYPDRTAYLEQLVKICPDALTWENGNISIKGPATFTGANVESTDLRGSMALVLAGLLAEGTTKVENVGMALRGYNDLLGKLSKLGIEYKLD